MIEAVVPYHGAKLIISDTLTASYIVLCAQFVSPLTMTSKRKYAEISGGGATSNDSSDQRLGLQQRQVEHLLEQGKKALFKSLKVARGFERQKLGRRQNTAKAEKAYDDLQRLNSEVAALKVCASEAMA